MQETGEDEQLGGGKKAHYPARTMAESRNAWDMLGTGTSHWRQTTAWKFK